MTLSATGPYAKRTLQNRFVCSQTHLPGKFLNTARCFKKIDDDPVMKKDKNRHKPRKNKIISIKNKSHKNPI